MRAFQHFDAGQIMQFDICLPAAAILFVTRGDDRFIIINANGCGARTVDAADDIFLVAGAEILKLQLGIIPARSENSVANISSMVLPPMA
ncbi:hypothetical protein JCM17845_11590 [Iodidimonas gelatinilytica]|uniref:Uncharacterized protein n=1 Tax=Iodidimonas gelatinilytica TaxID=1236966 RepID=A0A5A7N0F8_9PROT|nr:hypothetical protein JCM17845_11590 [Iodidimonas gelatinilytica]